MGKREKKSGERIEPPGGRGEAGNVRGAIAAHGGDCVILNLVWFDIDEGPIAQRICIIENSAALPQGWVLATRCVVLHVQERARRIWGLPVRAKGGCRCESGRVRGGTHM